MKRLISLLVIALVIAQCGDGGDRAANAGAGEFGLFLTKGEVPPSRLVLLSHIELADEPLLGGDDMAAYIRDSHAIVLTPSGRSKLDTLQVPVSGRSFAVAVDRGLVYSGAFWTLISSISFSGPVIVLPAVSDTVRIEIGYPGKVGGEEYEDPRDNAQVMAALAAGGKLR